MYSTEVNIYASSDYYVYTPSALARRLYLYPICVGHFYYEPNYQLARSRYDSFLLMCITKGNCVIEIGGQEFYAGSGDVVLIDCYNPHKYGSYTSWEALWMHFDGPMARTFYEEIYNQHGNIIPSSAQLIHASLDKIHNNFQKSIPVSEPVLSESITGILNNLLSFDAQNSSSTHTGRIAQSITFISEHFAEDIALETLAGTANLSPYHFTRIFTRETGFTPHQYIIQTRLAAAKYLLKSSELTVKDIGFSVGFHSETSFCTTFKKREKITPSQYREQSGNNVYPL